MWKLISTRSKVYFRRYLQQINSMLGIASFTMTLVSQYNLRLHTYKVKIILFVLLAVFNMATAGELEDRETIQVNISKMFLNEQFSDLSALSKNYLNSKERTSSGIWKLTLFYAGLSQAIEKNNINQNYWSEVEMKALRWIKAEPNSPSAYISYASILIDHGWMYRGSGWASTVKNENWKPFHEYIRKAKNYLIENKNVAESDPRWNEMMLVIARAEGWNQVDFERLSNQAINKFPDFYQIYFSSIDYLTPKWHGNKELIEEFAQKSTAKTMASDKTGMYARIYWYASQTNYGEKLFTDSSVVWGKMSRSIDDVLAKYPDQWNINNFAYFSCLAKDKAKTKGLMDKIQGAPLDMVWKSLDFYNNCILWSHES